MYHLISFFQLIDCIDPILQSSTAICAVDAVDKNNYVDTGPVSPEVVKVAVVASTVKDIHGLGILINLDDALFFLYQ